MSVTGPARQSLTAQLQEKLAEERRVIEALTTAELQQLATNLSKSSRAALDVMERDMDVRLSSMRNRLVDIETQQKRWPLWTALGSAVIALAAFALLWIITSWVRSDLKTVLSERYEARQVLDTLQEQTHGISLVEAAEGTFLIVPESTEKSWWTCGDASCLKLSE